MSPMLGGLELERAVLDVEVPRQAVAEPVQHDSAVAVGEHPLRDHHVRGKHG